MTISKLKFLGAAALACALALGGAQTLTLGQSSGPTGRQEPAAGKDAVLQLAGDLKHETASVVTRFADVLKRHPPRRGTVEGERMQLYILDLVQGGTTLIADEPVPGLGLCGGPPKWSHLVTRRPRILDPQLRRFS